MVSSIEQHKHVITQARDFVRARQEFDASGHDYLHSERVWKLATHIAGHYDVDSIVVELAALFHDISDYKLNGGNEVEGPRMARQWVEQAGLGSARAEHVSHIIGSMSYRKNLREALSLTLEGKIVQDADRLDAIGAVGIARAFAFGGTIGQRMISPAFAFIADQAPGENLEKTRVSTVGHFFEKLLLLKDRLNTPEARQIAAVRHDFMIEYLEQLGSEIDFAP